MLLGGEAVTAPIDVRAVMGLARESLRNSGQQTPEGLAIHSAVAQASSAIAELIEADKEYDAAKHAHACIAHESYAVEAWYDHDERLRAASQRLLLAGERRRTALANVSGGA